MSNRCSEVFILEHELLLLVLLVAHDVDSGLVFLLCLLLHHSQSRCLACLVKAEVI